MTTTVLELAKENFKFSAGHFTILSSTERENLHGHNFTVKASITCLLGDNGMTFDYRLAKRAIEHECRALNETFLLPAESPHLRLEEEKEFTWAIFGNERIPFLSRDITILPVRNVTVEELSRYLLDRLVMQIAHNQAYDIEALSCTVSSGPGQGASAHWER